jgi:hypothetical protein
MSVYKQKKKTETRVEAQSRGNKLLLNTLQATKLACHGRTIPTKNQSVTTVLLIQKADTFKDTKCCGYPHSQIFAASKEWWWHLCQPLYFQSRGSSS